MRCHRRAMQFVTEGSQYDIDRAAYGNGRFNFDPATGNVAAIDGLPSEGIVVSMADLGILSSDAEDDEFVEVEIPVDRLLLFLDRCAEIAGLRIACPAPRLKI